jgi:hypothetical protein
MGRWLASSRPEDLESAIVRLLEADAILADDAPGRLRLEGNLGIGFASRYSVTGSPQDRDMAVVFLGRMLGRPGADDDFDELRLSYGQLLAASWWTTSSLPRSTNACIRGRCPSRSTSSARWPSRARSTRPRGQQQVGCMRS